MQGAEEQLVGKMNRRISLITGLDTSGTFTYPDDDDWIQVIVREAFKRKKRKYIGFLPILGGVPPDQYISGFFLKKKHFYLKNDLYAQKHVKSE